MSRYTVKVYKDRKVIAEESWDSNEWAPGDPMAAELASLAGGMIEEAVMCNERTEDQ